MDIRDKVVIITGGSEGIGLSTARLLAEHGAQVVISARNKEKVEAAARETRGLAIVADMRKLEDVECLVSQTLDRFGRIDILINNAGQGLYGPIETLSLKDYRSILELNVFGVLAAMQAVIPTMHKQRSGMIVNVSSGTSRMVLPNAGAYASTKAALNMLSLVARAELAKDNIIVSVIYPYITATAFGENALESSNRPVGQRPGIPPPHSSEFVAEKILELIGSEEAEMVLKP